MAEPYFILFLHLEATGSRDAFVCELMPMSINDTSPFLAAVRFVKSGNDFDCTYFRPSKK